MGLLRAIVGLGLISIAATSYDSWTPRESAGATSAPLEQAREAYALCRSAGTLCADVAAAGFDSAREQLITGKVETMAEPAPVPAAVPLPPRRPGSSPRPQKP